VTVYVEGPTGRVGVKWDDFNGLHFNENLSRRYGTQGKVFFIIKVLYGIQEQASAAAKRDPALPSWHLNHGSHGNYKAEREKILQRAVAMISGPQGGHSRGKLTEL